MGKSKLFEIGPGPPAATLPSISRLEPRGGP